MEKKYYDAPQMEIVKLQHNVSLLENSPLNQSNDRALVDTETNSYSNSLAGQFFGGDDGGEDW